MEASARWMALPHITNSKNSNCVVGDAAGEKSDDVRLMPRSDIVLSGDIMSDRSSECWSSFARGFQIT